MAQGGSHWLTPWDLVIYGCHSPGLLKCRFLHSLRSCFVFYAHWPNIYFPRNIMASLSITATTAGSVNVDSLRREASRPGTVLASAVEALKRQYPSRSEGDLLKLVNYSIRREKSPVHKWHNLQYMCQYSLTSGERKCSKTVPLQSKWLCDPKKRKPRHPNCHTVKSRIALYCHPQSPCLPSSPEAPLLDFWRYSMA